MPIDIYTNTDYPLTSEYWIDAKSQGLSSRLLVFIPGNPGLIDYYVTYMNIISEKYPGYDVLVVGHAGYQTSGDYLVAAKGLHPDFYDLDYQIDHKVKILKKRILDGHDQLSFMCHSVGSFITQRVIKKLLEDKELEGKVRIEFVGFICPTIVDIAKSDSGVLFTKLFNNLPVVTLAVWFVCFLQFLLTDSLARSIIKKYAIDSPCLNDKRLIEAHENAVDATFKIYKSPRIVRQALSLAREELNVIHRDDQLNDWFFETLPRNFDVKIWCFFAFNDYWVHDNTRDYILGRYHNLENESVKFQVGDDDKKDFKSIGHSFCVDQTVEFAKVTIAALEEMKFGK
ncbi:hypothetical protein PUMCH_001224 [Australozyma saopauloensis]|uniref:Lipid droplet-associated hydrolase n=1 Tax=Australozyma saopauloensis TaxID=291208 RepID=A0AAX4H5V4_9ASCO|nr:hypothetical protein PUMCH_001224 [[Candida] saopauloensis]